MYQLLLDKINMHKFAPLRTLVLLIKKSVMVLKMRVQPCIRIVSDGLKQVIQAKVIITMGKCGIKPSKNINQNFIK